MARRSGFLSSVAVLLFVSVCAYVFARLYGTVNTVKAGGTNPTVKVDGIALDGLVIREEMQLRVGVGIKVSAEDGRRYRAGAVLGDVGGDQLLAPCSSVYFKSCDGLEYLNVEMCDKLTVASLDALLRAQPSSPGSVCGRLVTANDWYYAAYTDSEISLEPGTFCLLRFDGFDKTLRASIISLSESIGSRRAVLLRLTAGGEYLSLRRCSALMLCS